MPNGKEVRLGHFINYGEFALRREKNGNKNL